MNSREKLAAKDAAAAAALEAERQKQAAEAKAKEDERRRREEEQQHKILQSQQQQQTSASLPATTSGTSQTTNKYRAVFPFTARSEDELSFEPGDIILVFEGHAAEPGWRAGQIRDKVGYAFNLVQMNWNFRSVGSQKRLQSLLLRSYQPHKSRFKTCLRTSLHHHRLTEFLKTLH